MAKKSHGKTTSGVPITDELIAELAARAEAGYDVDDILRRRGGNIDGIADTSDPPGEPKSAPRCGP